jgi:hypothetical protein
MGKNGVAFAKVLLGCTHTLVEYLGRYTLKIAISNIRIMDILMQILFPVAIVITSKRM